MFLCVCAGRCFYMSVGGWVYVSGQGYKSNVCVQVYVCVCLSLCMIGGEGVYVRVQVCVVYKVYVCLCCQVCSSL